MRRRSESIRDKLLPAGAFLLLLLAWWGIAASGLVPGYMLPSPVDVIRAFIGDFPNLVSHAWVSVEEALAGLALGVGMLVDNSIVVIDNIYRLRQEEGRPILHACVEGVKSVSGALYPCLGSMLQNQEKRSGYLSATSFIS